MCSFRVFIQQIESNVNRSRSWTKVPLILFDYIISIFRMVITSLLVILDNFNILQCAAFTSLGVICISTLCFILSTLPELQDEEEYEV